MKVSRTVAAILAGAAASAAIAAPSFAADITDAQDALAPVTQDAGTILNAVTSEAGLKWGMGTEGNMDHEDGDGGNDADDFGSAYGDAVFHDKQSALVASYGAPLVHVDFRCVDAMGGIGGYGNGVLGNSAKCNLDDVTQVDDSNGLIG
ncbi:hypothetical protein [Glycomyces terrestris]|uniref:Uncharacterized protein n=1 Tax=Glycomyces terrestris TaxID=2493553 RepID=A0A426UXC5_9ACTN|nr:hypothetical protein [Glycomyces terrestris]RRR99264.1 hypothetical protein EIW28_11080 [Glycomyces terrestris]